MSDPWPVGLANAWHPIAYLDEIGRKPVARMLMDRPLAVFRGEGGLAVLEDRCPHRNVPLSAGRIEGGALACPYHGWRFDHGGTLLEVPGAATCPRLAVRRYPAVERAGLLWTNLADDPVPFPELPAALGDSARNCFWWPLAASRGRMADAIENILDPMHSYFVHPGFVRASRDPIPMDLELTLGPRGCLAVYTEDRSTMTWLQRLAEGDRICSNNRFIAPNMTEVEFVGSKGVSITITTVLSPETVDRTRPFAHFAIRRGRLPGWLDRLFLKAFLLPVIRQDRRALRLQAENTARFGGPAYTMGPLDFFGPMIWRLLNGKPQPEETIRVRLGTVPHMGISATSD